MSLVLNVSSAEDIKKFRNKLKNIQIQILQFQAITIRKLANIIIVDSIHQRMRRENFSDKIINNTILSNIEIKNATTVRLHFTSTYFSETGFDVALGREKGTKDHDVYPSQPTPERPNPSLSYIVGGKRVFYKHTHPKGIKALHIIENTVKELSETLQLKYDNELRHWMSKNLKESDFAS